MRKTIRSSKIIITLLSLLMTTYASANHSDCSVGLIAPAQGYEYLLKKLKKDGFNVEEDYRNADFVISVTEKIVPVIPWECEFTGCLKMKIQGVTMVTYRQDPGANLIIGYNTEKDYKSSYKSLKPYLEIGIEKNCLK